MLKDTERILNDKGRKVIFSFFFLENALIIKFIRIESQFSTSYN